jgi:acyl carrier protein
MLMAEPLESNTAVLTISERLLGIVRRVLGPSFALRPLPIDARLADLGVTSIKMVNLMLSVEAEFDITIPQGEINPENFASLASIEALLSRMLLSPTAHERSPLREHAHQCLHILEAGPAVRGADPDDLPSLKHRAGDPGSP